jgi:hypothetical protein
MPNQPEVIVCNFKKSDAVAMMPVEKRFVRFGKSLIPPVLFLHETGDGSGADSLFMKSSEYLSDRVQLLRTDD